MQLLLNVLLRSHWRGLCPTSEAPRLEDAWNHSSGSLTPMSPTSSGSSRLMKRRRGFVIAAALVACALKTHPVEARGPSTQEERAQFVALVRSLERDPLAE